LDHDSGTDEPKNYLSSGGLTAMSERRLRHWILVVAFGVFLTAGANVTMAQTATTVSTTIKEPLNFAAQTCDTLQPITFTGTQDTVYDVVNDGTGVLTLKVHASWENVVGMIAGGRTFAGLSTSDETIELDSLPSEQTVTVNQRWIGKDDGPNLVYTLKFNLKIGADGTVTSSKSSEVVECKQ
jgi:hypothetical protein